MRLGMSLVDLFLVDKGDDPLFGLIAPDVALPVAAARSGNPAAGCQMPFGPLFADGHNLGSGSNSNDMGFSPCISFATQQRFTGCGKTLVSEGYGRQAVRKCIRTNAALEAAEGLVFFSP
jgi:hypothetical protein